MAGVGVSPTDLVTGIKLCQWIYKHCFEQVSKADAQYILFGKAIKGLEETLALLSKQIEAQAQAQYQLPNSNGYVAAPGSSGSVDDLKDAVGDYESTLEECQRLLRTHKEFEKTNDFVKNVRWGISIQDKVNALNMRIQAHNGKLHLLLQPFQSRELHQIQNMLALLTYRLTPPPPLEEARIPVYAASRFEETLSMELQSRGETMDSISRSETLDALYKHWRRSQYNQQEDFGEYLSLLKCAWLIVRMEKARPFKTAREGLPYRVSVLEIRRHVAARYANDELFTKFGADLARLEGEAYFLLDDAQETHELPLDEYSLEEKLLEIQLSDAPRTKQALKVSRIGPTQIRLVRENTREAANAVLLESDSIDIESDRLIPFYAVPGSHPTLGLEILNCNGAAKRAYVFRSLRDVLTLQQAFTNYAVMSDISDVGWNYKEPGLLRRNKTGTCRLQIWHWQPLQSDSRSNRLSLLSDSLTHRMSTQSGVSGTSTSTLAQVMRGVDITLLESSFASLVGDGDGSSNSIVTSESPHHPCLVVYTMIDDAYGYLHIEMDPDLRIDPGLCYCCKQPERCRRVVLSVRNRSTFELRKLATRGNCLGSSLDEWNLSTFGRASTYGMERNQAFYDRRVKVIKVSWLTLDFGTVEARKKFESHFAYVEDLRNKEMHKIEAFKKHVGYLSQRPREVTSGSTPSSSPSTRQNGIFGTNSSENTLRAPQISSDVGAIHASLPSIPAFRPITMNGLASYES